MQRECFAIKSSPTPSSALVAYVATSQLTFLLLDRIFFLHTRVSLCSSSFAVNRRVVNIYFLPSFCLTFAFKAAKLIFRNRWFSWIGVLARTRSINGTERFNFFLYFCKANRTEKSSSLLLNLSFSIESTKTEKEKRIELPSQPFGHSLSDMKVKRRKEK